MLSDRMQTQDAGGWGWVTIPAIAGTPLVTPTRGIVVTTAGNLFVVAPDGSTNPIAIPVTASPWPLPYAVVAYGVGNTAVAIGVI